MIVRPIHKSDLEVCENIGLCCVRKFYSLNDNTKTHFEHNFIHRTNKMIDFSNGFVCESNNVIVGFCFLTVGNEVEGLYVSYNQTSSRKKIIIKCLLEKIEEAVISCGFNYILLKVLEDIIPYTPEEYSNVGNIIFTQKKGVFYRLTILQKDFKED